jgi:predicted nucleic acid-binding protein
VHSPQTADAPKLSARTRLDFGDTLIAASMLPAKETALYAYDKPNDITRLEP